MVLTVFMRQYQDETKVVNSFNLKERLLRWSAPFRHLYCANIGSKQTIFARGIQLYSFETRLKKRQNTIDFVTEMRRHSIGTVVEMKGDGIVIMFESFAFVIQRIFFRTQKTHGKHHKKENGSVLLNVR